MLYALMGLGLSLITGVLNIPNFAHGALFAIGAKYTGLALINFTRSTVLLVVTAKLVNMR